MPSIQIYDDMTKDDMRVLNLVISGMPSIHKEYKSKIETVFEF